MKLRSVLDVCLTGAEIRMRGGLGAVAGVGH